MKKVYLVGAGPGDPELITLKAKRLLSGAEVILYDHLANAELLRFAPANAERIYVGKKKSDHAMSQQEICDLLVDLGRRGRCVVRLKGGDPFIFGRGGEEAEALALAGIPFEVVPGVTAPLGVAAYTGVPLTHRDHTSVVTFITGHDVAKIDWRKVGTSETLVIFMGLSHFDEIAPRIVEGGRPADTPAMAVRWGTRPDQEVIAGTLETLPRLLHEHNMRPPATIVVGDVVSLRERLSWFEQLPLFRQRIVVTRPREQAGPICDTLRHLGADVVELPTIEIQPPKNPSVLDSAIETLPSFDWLIFTSANGVRGFLERLDASRRDVRSVQGRICAIGPATREALEQFHIKTDIMATEYVAEGVIDALSSFQLRGAHVLIARAAVARDVLPFALERRGALVTVAEAYCTGMPDGLAARAAEVFARPPSWVTFTSSSTAQNLIETVGAETIRRSRVASIGPITSGTLRRFGIEPAIQAPVYTASGLVDAILSAGIIGS